MDGRDDPCEVIAGVQHLSTEPDCSRNRKKAKKIGEVESPEMRFET